MTSPQKKVVLVQLGEFNRLVTFETSDECTERESFLTEVRRSFSKKIGDQDKLTLQTQHSDWDGVYVDYFSDSIEDKSRFKLIVEQSTGNPSTVSLYEIFLTTFQMMFIKYIGA